MSKRRFAELFREVSASKKISMTVTEYQSHLMLLEAEGILKVSSAAMVREIILDYLCQIYQGVSA